MIYNILEGIVMDERRRKALREFQDDCNISFSDVKLLNQAFFHSSYINENSNVFCDNEKLEFLGDAVLALITVDHLYKSFPDRSEGELSRLKSTLVSAATLSEFGKKINLSKYLLLGRGEKKCGGQARPSLIADTFEALLGAMYLDSGISQARDFVVPFLQEYIKKIEESNHVKDYKTCFQLFVQQKFKTIPIYETVDEAGPDHAKVFFVRVVINERICGHGKGKSKKTAQQEAAKDAIEKIDDDDFELL